MASDGRQLGDIAAALHVSIPTVRLWMIRYHANGVDALRHDASGRGRRPTARIAEFRAKLLAALGGDLSGHPSGTSIRELASTFDVSPSTVWRALQALRRT